MQLVCVCVCVSDLGNLQSSVLREAEVWVLYDQAHLPQHRTIQWTVLL